MTKDELIAKQQIEIEDLKAKYEGILDICRQSSLQLIYAEQWNTKCNDFPKIAMKAIVTARAMLESI